MAIRMMNFLKFLIVYLMAIPVLEARFYADSGTKISFLFPVLIALMFGGTIFYIVKAVSKK
jgi:hypothetical protein